MNDDNPIRYRVSKKDRKIGDIPNTQTERRISKLDRLVLSTAIDKESPDSYLEIVKRIKQS